MATLRRLQSEACGTGDRTSSKLPGGASLGPAFSKAEGLPTHVLASLIGAAAMPSLWLLCLANLQSDPTGFPYKLQALFLVACSVSLFAPLAISKLRARPVFNRLSIKRRASAHRGATLALSLAVGIALSACAARALLQFESRDAFGPLVMCLGGCSFALLVLGSYSSCCQLDLRSCLSALLLSFALAALVRLALVATASPALFTAAFLAAASVGALVALWAARPALEAWAANRLDAPMQKALRPEEPVGLRPHLTALVEIAFCGVILGVFMGPVESAGTAAGKVANYLLRIAAPLLVLALLQAHMDRRSYRPMQTLLSALIAALCAAVLIGGSAFGASVAGGVFSTTRNCMLIIVYLAAIRATVETGLSPTCCIGLFRGAYEGSQALGLLLNGALVATEAPVLQAQDAALPVAGIVLAVAVGLLISTLANLPTGDAGQRGGSRLAAACARLGKEHELTAREEQLLSMLCHGVSNARAADELCVSVNTVRWHTQHIYDKLGVHSRAEMQALAERLAEDPGEC